VQIDWLTVAAQIVNFLVLVWLLQRFLYRPISAAMRRREARIEDRLAQARTTRQEAAEEVERLGKERAALAEERDGILDKARADAVELRQDLEAELRAEMEDKRKTWQRHLEEERDEFTRRLQRHAGQRLIDIAERVLADFAGTDLSERIATTFVSRLESLDEDARARLVEATRQADSAVVATGRPLDPTTRGKITRALHEALASDIPVAYREDEDMLLGVRLTIGDQTVEWSAARHLRRLETALDEILDSEGRGPHAAGTAQNSAATARPPRPERSAT
jgi:F-type H+-transporting ATPase subunit b